MDDALFVRGFQRLGDLLRDRQRLIKRYRAARNALGQILPFDEFHHQRTRCLPEPVEVDFSNP